MALYPTIPLGGLTMSMSKLAIIITISVVSIAIAIAAVSAANSVKQSITSHQTAFAAEADKISGIQK